MMRAVRRFAVGCLALVGLLVVIGIVVAITTNGKSGTTKQASMANGHVGTTFSVPGNLDVTLVSYRTSKGSQFELPKPGYEWVITSWRFKNAQSSNVDVAPTGFTAQAKGVIRQPEFFSTLDPNLLDVAGTSLAPGGSTTGDILFDVPKGGSVKVIYQPDSFDTSKVATWTVNG